MKRFLFMVVIVSLMLFPATALGTPPQAAAGDIGDGTISGTFEGVWGDIVYKGNTRRVQFAGTVDGTPCEFQFKIEFFNPQGLAYWTIQHATCNVQGQGTWFLDGTLKYEGKIHFHP